MTITGTHCTTHVQAHTHTDWVEDLNVKVLEAHGGWWRAITIEAIINSMDITENIGNKSHTKWTVLH